MIDDASAAINAGGRGLRLGGVRKALLRFADGTTLLEKTSLTLRALFSEVVLVANETEPYDASGMAITGDRIPDRGAPGGLHAALSTIETPWLFFVACDMPRLDPALVERLAALRRTDLDAVVPTLDGRVEPMHAFWSRRALPALDRLLREGEPSFRELLGEIPHALVGCEERRESFGNVNTPEDLARFGLRAPTSR